MNAMFTGSQPKQEVHSSRPKIIKHVIFSLYINQNPDMQLVFWLFSVFVTLGIINVVKNNIGFGVNLH